MRTLVYLHICLDVSAFAIIAPLAISIVLIMFYSDVHFVICCPK